MANTLTISGLITTGVSLAEATTITSSGTVESGVAAAVVGGANAGILLNAGEIAGSVFGVSISGNGAITNQASGRIGGTDGIFVGGSGSIDNAGAINGVAFGVILNQGGLVNERSGEISGGVQFSSGTLTNDGTIGSAVGDIVYFSNGGTVLNLGTAAALTGGDVLGVAIAGRGGLVSNQGSISGVSMLAGGAATNAGYIATGNSSFGVSILGASGYVKNTGHIVGIDLEAGGAVANQTGGIVSGYLDGIDLGAGGTVTNNGSVLGIGGRFSAVESGRDGISLSGYGTIVNGAGALIKGSNDGIMLTGTGTGSVTVINHGIITGKKGIVVDSSLSTTIIDYGTIAGTGGTAIAFEQGNDVLVLGSGAVIDGIIVGGNPTLDVNLSIEGTFGSASGGIQLLAGGALLVGSTMAASQTISFAGTDATLEIGDPNHFFSEISGISASDVIDLGSDSFDPAGRAYLAAHNVLEIVGTGTVSLQLNPNQNFAGEFFHISSDGLNGTDVSESAVPCFLAGTRIATAAGEVAVETLKIGDHVLNGAGQSRPVKWIGRRCYRAPLPDHQDVIPVLVRKGALAPEVPRADLYLSPRHALRVDEFLVPAGALINGISVLPCPDIAAIDYYHIELAAHDTVIANGAEAETFIDQDSRRMFDNAEEFYQLYPNDWAAGFVLCAPRLEFGAELEALRRRIALRAGLLLDQAADNPVVGFLETASRQVISGWAYAPATPNVPVVLAIFNRGALLARCVANMPRQDVRDAGFGNGRCGFNLTLPAPLPALLRHEISVRPDGAATPLPGSPAIIDPGIAHDLLKTGGLKTLIDAAVQGLGSKREIADLGDTLEAAGRQIRLTARAPARHAAPAQDDERPVVLVLDGSWPTVTHDAGSNAIISHVEAFLRLGYAVSFCAIGGPPDHADAAAGLEALRQRGVQCHGQDGAATEDTIRALAARGLDVVYLHRLAAAAAYSVLVRQHAPKAKLIFAVADLHHVRLARQAAVCNRPDLAVKARSVKAAELWAMQLADCVITHSRAELAYLRREAPRANVHVVPWAVPADPPLGTGRNRRDVAFIGGAGHAPNLDAVMHLAREVMPLVWAADPAIRCLVAGSGWTGNLFGGFDARLVNLGHQQELQPLLRSVRMTVAPLRFGAGIKGKVLESMAAGTPCVMSRVAAEGLPFDPRLRAAIGDGPDFAENLLRIYRDKKLDRVLRQAGLDLIETCFSAEAVTAALAEVVGRQPAAARQADVQPESRSASRRSRNAEAVAATLD